MLIGSDGMNNRSHFKILKNSIRLIFVDEVLKRETQMICSKDEFLSTVIERLISSNFIKKPADGSSWRCFQNGKELRPYPILALNLQDRDRIYLAQKQDIEEDLHKIKIVCLYGCPSSMDIKGIVPDCMLVYFDNYYITER